MSAAPADSLLIYLDEFTDEVMPISDCTAQGWADWLAKPDAEWRRNEPAKDGDTFPATVMRMEDDIIATRRAGKEWTFSHEVRGASLLACRWAEGLGWDGDSIVGNMEDLREWFAQNSEFCEDVEHVAVGFYEPPMLATFRMTPDGPRLKLAVRA